MIIDFASRRTTLIFDYTCKDCGTFEAYKSMDTEFIECPLCSKPAEKQFHATTNFHIPSYFHTCRSDIFTHEEWQDLKKDPNIERAK